MQIVSAPAVTYTETSSEGIFLSLKRWVLLRFILDTSYFKNLSDRKWLADKFMPKLSALRNQRILFVGCEYYTWENLKVFHESIDLVTVDYNEKSFLWGGKHHFIADIREIDCVLGTASFDMIVLNGVFGHGVNTTEDQSRTFKALRHIMKPEALLMVGWNHDLSQDPIELLVCQELFYRTNYEDLPKRTCFSDSTHVFDFLKAKSRLTIY